MQYSNCDVKVYLLMPRMSWTNARSYVKGTSDKMLHIEAASISSLADG